MDRIVVSCRAEKKLFFLARHDVPGMMHIHCLFQTSVFPLDMCITFLKHLSFCIYPLLRSILHVVGVLYLLLLIPEKDFQTVQSIFFWNWSLVFHKTGLLPLLWSVIRTVSTMSALIQQIYSLYLASFHKNMLFHLQNLCNHYT